MENEENRELLNVLSVSPLQVDRERLTTILEKYPYAGAVRVLDVFQQIYADSMDAEQGRRRLALFSQLTFNFPLLYDQWEASVQQKSKVVSESIEDIEIEGGFEDATSTSQITLNSVKNDAGAPEGDTKPSRYHDDLMPFSFLWWLNKTRIEFSDTYQPYASDVAPAAKTDHVDWIDQQIKENIFHMQSPEALLSDPATKNTISFEIGKKRRPEIEKFIKEEPQIKPPSATKINLENKARKSAEDESGFVSETLAKIYSEQGLYLKAIETYKKLSLKFPEKSPYFAKLIEKLNEKIN